MGRGGEKQTKTSCGICFPPQFFFNLTDFVWNTTKKIVSSTVTWGPCLWGICFVRWRNGLLNLWQIQSAWSSVGLCWLSLGLALVRSCLWKHGGLYPLFRIGHLNLILRFLYSLLQWYFGFLLLLFFPPFRAAYCVPAERPLFRGHLQPHQPLHLPRHCRTPGNEVRTRVRRPPFCRTCVSSVQLLPLGYHL